MFLENAVPFQPQIKMRKNSAWLETGDFGADATKEFLAEGRHTVALLSQKHTQKQS